MCDGWIRCVHVLLELSEKCFQIPYSCIVKSLYHFLCASSVSCLSALSNIFQNNSFLMSMLLPRSDVTHMNTPKSEERLSNPGSTWMQQKPSVSVPVHPKGVGWLEAGDSGEEELDSIPQSGTTVPLWRVLSCWKQERDEHKLLTHNLKKSSNPQMNPHRKYKSVNKWIKTPAAFLSVSEVFGCLPLCQRTHSRFFVTSESLPPYQKQRHHHHS